MTKTKSTKPKNLCRNYLGRKEIFKQKKRKKENGQNQK